MFSDKDLEQIKAKGISMQKIAQQLKNFEQGFPFMQIVKAATIGDGILKVKSKEVDEFERLYENEIENYQVFKFVPASGAASRMFKSLFSFMESFDGSADAIKAMEKDQSFGSIQSFF